jgi:hypothetical protein
MKKFILMLMCVLTLTFLPINKAQARIKQVSKTEWVEDTTKSKKQPKTPDKRIGTYTKKNGKKYPVYQGPRGGKYWVDDNGRRRYDLPKK